MFPVYEIVTCTRPAEHFNSPKGVRPFPGLLFLFDSSLEKISFMHLEVRGTTSHGG